MIEIAGGLEASLCSVELPLLIHPHRASFIVVIFCWKSIRLPVWLKIPKIKEGEFKC